MSQATARPRPRPGAHRGPVQRGPATRAPRRVSGPARHAPRPVTAPGGAHSLPRRGTTSTFERVLAVADHRVVDRLLRSRLWIILVGALLGGIVAMQVSLLKLNSGISRAIETTATLERQNGQLEAAIARLGATERIRSTALMRGMVLPPAGEVEYLRVRPGDAVRAARRMVAPSDEALALLANGGIVPGTLVDATAMAAGTSTGVADPAVIAGTATDPAATATDPTATADTTTMDPAATATTTTTDPAATAATTTTDPAATAATITTDPAAAAATTTDPAVTTSATTADLAAAAPDPAATTTPAPALADPAASTAVGP